MVVALVNLPPVLIRVDKGDKHCSTAYPKLILLRVVCHQPKGHSISRAPPQNRMQAILPARGGKIKVRATCGQLLTLKHVAGEYLPLYACICQGWCSVHACTYLGQAHLQAGVGRPIADDQYVGGEDTSITLGKQWSATRGQVSEAEVG